MAIFQTIESKHSDERKRGLFLASLEYGNLHRALMLALAQGSSIMACYGALAEYIDAQQDHQRGLELGEAVRAALERAPPAGLTAQQLAERIGVIENIGKRFLLLKRFNEAEAAYQQAEALANNPDLPATYRASIVHQLGMVAQEQRRFDEAAGYYRQSLDIKREHGDRHGAAATYHQLGIVALQQRRFDEAAGYYRQSLDIMLEYGDRPSAALTYHQLGNVAEKQRRFDEAAGYYRQSLDIKLEHGDRHGAATTYHQLGNVAQHQRRFDEAAGYYRQSLDNMLEYGDRHSAALTFGQLGILMRRTGRHAECLDYYLSALSIFAEAGDGGHLAGIALHNLAILWRAWGDDIVITRAAEVAGWNSAKIRAAFEQMPPDDPATP